MSIPVVYLFFVFSVICSIPVIFDAHRRRRRSPAFDALIVAVIPLLGLLMYVSSVRMGLTPPTPGQDDDSAAPPIGRRQRMPKALQAINDDRDVPSPGIVAELTAEVRRLRSELETAQAEIARLQGPHQPDA